MPRELEPEQHNPDKNLQTFSRTNLLLWLLVAVLIHVFIIGSTSVGYVYDTVFAPDKEQKEKGEKEAEDRKKASGEESADKEKATDEGDGKEAQTESTDEETAADTEHERKMKERAESDVVKQTKETASPEDVPNEPGDLGLDIDDTNE